MTTRLAGNVPIRFFLFFAAALLLFFMFSNVLFQEGVFQSFAILMGIIVFALTLVKTEWALVVLIFATLLSPEMEMGAIGKRALTVRIEDILLVVLVMTWLAKVAISKELGFLRKTPLNNAIKAFVVVCVLSTILGILRGNVYAPK